ncbi:MAG: hypothetical protein LBH04_05575 [Tannerellaceae bacterium]|nr:hypothetical protein [Tannerellaceae bacterium]
MENLFSTLYHIIITDNSDIFATAAMSAAPAVTSASAVFTTAAAATATTILPAAATATATATAVFIASAVGKSAAKDIKIVFNYF